jgi:hypothetical protein
VCDICYATCEKCDKYACNVCANEENICKICEEIVKCSYCDNKQDTQNMPICEKCEDSVCEECLKDDKFCEKCENLRNCKTCDEEQNFEDMNTCSRCDAYLCQGCTQLCSNLDDDFPEDICSECFEAGDVYFTNDGKSIAGYRGDVRDRNVRENFIRDVRIVLGETEANDFRQHLEQEAEELERIEDAVHQYNYENPDF